MLWHGSAVQQALSCGRCVRVDRDGSPAYKKASHFKTIHDVSLVVWCFA